MKTASIQEMNRQKDMARKAMREKGGSAWGQGTLPDGVDRNLATVFTGYDTLADNGTVRAILVADEATEALALTDLAVERPDCHRDHRPHPVLWRFRRPGRRHRPDHRTER